MLYNLLVLKHSTVKDEYNNIKNDEYIINNIK